MAFMLVHGRCVACGTPISFNPDHVPSLRVDGRREPICRGCFGRWNTLHRTGRGLPPIPLHPDAYAPQEVP